VTAVGIKHLEDESAGVWILRMGVDTLHCSALTRVNRATDMS